MQQRSVAGTALLILAGLSAILAIIAATGYSNVGEALDASYAWGGILLAVVCGGWAYYFLRPQKEVPAPATPPAK